MEKICIDAKGFYGEFGGAYVPEALKKNLEELNENYEKYYYSEDFQRDYKSLLKDYVGRPSPLYYASNLSEKYGAKIYLKREDLNHTGSHKINNTLGQILLANYMGKKKIIAETGAGQHGVATATACALMNMECIVFMGAVDMERQYLNVQKMKMLGAKVIPAKSGMQTLADAVNEALNYWIENTDSFYLLGSAVGPHPYPNMVAEFQSVISKEIKIQLLEKEGRDYPDYVFACVGGGSNAAGAFFEFINNDQTSLCAAEAGGELPEAGNGPSAMTNGIPMVLHGSKNLVVCDGNGEIKETSSISAGLDYPGVGPLFAHMRTIGRMDVEVISDAEAIKAAMELTSLEGIIPAIESSHALAALPKKVFDKKDIVVVNLSGRGDKDMDIYLKYFNK